MSQPEMRPEGASRDRDGSAARERDTARDGTAQDGTKGEGAKRGGESTREKSSKREEVRGDLLGRAFPIGDWGEPAQRLDELYQWVEQGALRTADWYLADRRWKRRAARTLRGGTVGSVAIGAALPLLELTDAFDTSLGTWGFVSLLSAAVCVGCDRYFGLTSGWMRDVATAQAVQRRLEELQYDWAAESVREALGPTEGTASEAAERCLNVLRRFTQDITEIVRAETADWIVEFRTSPAPLRAQAGRVGGPPRTEEASVPRFPPMPGNRPSMPRQRPPEGSR
ncbi:SLATT domain-containing protein [Streptomyces sp. N2-109]|uniref:SLATT domain-containing protein n=1 Tax=Streptomyces gossypii TaxID=2883101 RepID=A0ABT2JQ17_9ACTN|nr:SLATT domain-containing protein [Streptomyces gossypii]MCT2589465.1 SLATT domain-containing protein [Streptomyces gossypii]